MGRFKNLFIILMLFMLMKSGPMHVWAQETYSLSIEEVSELALANNFDIQLARYDARIARTDKGVAKSIYDTVIDMEVKYRNNQSKPVSSFAGNKILDNDYNFSASKKLPTGTTLTFDNTNNRNWTDSSYVTLNPSHDSSIGITVKQELGKNFFGLKDRGDIKITLLDVKNSEYTSLDKIETYLVDVQKAYWDLVLQTEKLRIYQDMVKQAKELFDVNTEKEKDGLAERPDVLAAEASYKQKTNVLLQAQNHLKTKENILRLLLNITDDQVSIVPLDVFSLQDQDERNEYSLRVAFENRYDYKEALNNVKAKDINLAMKKNDIWPEVNLTASLARNGVGEHFKQAYNGITEEDNPDFFAGLTISFPLENNEAKSKLKAAELEKAKILIDLKSLERKITVGIIDKVRNTNILKEVAANEMTVSQLQAQKLEAEEKRFSQGRSDTDTIVRFQNDVSLARITAVEAKYAYYAAGIDLRKEEGALLQKYWDEEL